MPTIEVFQPVPNTVELVMQYTIDGAGDFTNTFHFEKFGGWDESEISAFGLLPDEFWAEELQSWMTTNVKLTQVKVTDLSSETGFVTINGIGTDNTGTRAGAAPPKQVAASIRRRAAGRGRNRRGRIYHFGLAGADSINARQWNLTTVTNLATAYQNFTVGLASAGSCVNVLVSRYQNNVRLEEALTYPILTWDGAQKIATKARRLND